MSNLQRKLHLIKILFLQCMDGSAIEILALLIGLLTFRMELPGEFAEPVLVSCFPVQCIGRCSHLKCWFTKTGLVGVFSVMQAD